MFGDLMYYLIIIGKTLLFYVLLIIFMRIMGKREVGELGIFDIIVFFIISELFSISISNPKISVFMSIVPIIVIVLLQILTSKLCLKSTKFRELIDGKPSLIIVNGKIDLVELKKQRYNIDDLLLQLRDKNIDSPSVIKYAILESNGKLSVFKEEDMLTLYPLPIIKNGIIDEKILKILNINRNKLIKKLYSLGYDDISKIELCIIEKNRFYILDSLK